MSATYLVIVPCTQVFFSAFATTRAAAGAFENQYKLEHDLNIELVKAAKVSGTKVSLLISSASASKNSMFNYMNMKGEIDDIKALGFDHTIIAAGAYCWSRAGKKTSRSFNEAYSWFCKHD
jgi:hypothetical protein